MTTTQKTPQQTSQQPSQSAKPLIVDATQQIVGRLASKVAKASLMGHTIHVVNCEKAIISGKKEVTFGKYLHAIFGRGTPAKGPFISRRSDMLVRRIIRGMLPYNKLHGELAFKRIFCHIGVPAEFASQKLIQFDNAKLEHLKVLKYTTIAKIANHVGGKA
jgi:large subunit ribosomal protein L13